MDANDTQTTGKLDTLLSATLYLMSAFAAHRCPRLAIMIRRHLDLLAAHDCATPLLRSTCAQLVAQHWDAAHLTARETPGTLPSSPFPSVRTVLH